MQTPDPTNPAEPLQEPIREAASKPEFNAAAIPVSERDYRLECAAMRDEYLKRGWSIIHLEPRGKRPLIEWKLYQSQRATPEEVGQWWTERPTANIGIVLGAVSGLIVLDIDGPEGIETLKSLMPSGMTTIPALGWTTTGRGKHLYFSRPGGDVRTRRLGPGLELRAEGSYVVAPPSIHPLGKAYEWKSGPGDRPVTPPAWLLELKAEEKEVTPSTPGTIPNGERNDTLYRDGRAMHAKGMSPEAIEAALTVENEVRCEPPLPEAEVKEVAKKAATQADRPDFGAKVEEVKAGEQLPEEAPPEELPPFPEAAYVGLAGEFSAAYAEHLEAPRQFFYLDYLTYLGALVAPHVRLNSQLVEEPRLYTVKVGASWLSRKSSSQNEVGRFFGNLVKDCVTVCHGAGSAEGLAGQMKLKPSTILIYDEFRAFVDKARIEGSVLLPMVTSLFSQTSYENATKRSHISLRDKHLSMLAACTIDTFTTMFSPHVRALGALNRLFVVAGRRARSQPFPEEILWFVTDSLHKRTIEQVEAAEIQKPAIGFTESAEALWKDWYHALPESPYYARLDTYGLRLLMLFAVTASASQHAVFWEITRPMVEAVIALLDYEYKVRRVIDPVDAETTIARVEVLLLRSLVQGRMGAGRLRDRCGEKYTGTWAFDQAVRNLEKRGWLVSKQGRRGLLFWLTPAGMEAAQAREGNFHDTSKRGMDE